MLNEEQIREEARKKLASMDPYEKKALEDEIREGYEIVDIVKNNKGLNGLTPQQKSKFYYSETLEERRSNAGGIEGGVMENAIMKKLNISRDEIKTLKKNPFKASMYKQILLVALANLGMVVAAGVSKVSGVNLDIAYPVLSCVSGVFALSFGNKLVDCIRFRNLQKKYDDPSFQNKEIDAEVYKMIKNEVEQSRKM